MTPTLIGRILVIVITAVSLMLLGISTVAFSTARDWTKATVGVQKKVTDLKSELQKVKDEQDKAKRIVDDANKALADQTKRVHARLSALVEENKRDLDKTDAVRKQLHAAQNTANKTLLAVEAKRRQIDQLHQQQQAVDQQTKEFQAHDTHLTDLIRELERALQTTNKNKSDLQKKRPSPKISALVR